MAYIGIRPAGISSASQVETDQLTVDNVKIDGNTISSTDTNGNLSLDPDGTGDVIVSSGNVGIGGSETTVFNGVGGDMKLVVIGDDSATTVANNSDAAIAIVNTNQTAGNLAGLHFARADTDDSPNYSGAAIVAQFPDAQVTGQYPKGRLHFNTSTSANFAPSTKMTIDESGKVGIGTLPSTILHVEDGDVTIGNSTTTGDNKLVFKNASATLAEIRAADTSTGTGALLFTNNGSERLRITAAGDVLVGKTDTSINTQGVLFNPNFSHMSSTSDTPLALNRKTSDGPILNLRKDGSTVGGIGTQGGDLNIGTGNTGIYFEDGGNRIRPWDFGDNSSRDNSIDLGLSSARFNDAFITNGVTTGSDQTDKQQIASLTSAEMTAAKAISALFKTFKWNDAVAAKGDAARTHTGVMAQQVATALTDAGLNAGDYAFYMSNTWWEADEAYTDDDGNAQTRTVQYDTQADAPAGATQRTRLGIRYPELLAFVGAATEQRLADIEARLTALENA